MIVFSGEDLMLKRILIFTIVIFCFVSSIPAQINSEELKKLKFLLGEWESVSINQSTGKKSTGISSVKWVVGGKWLQWKFEAVFENRPLEVLTLINYNKDRRQYAFISFNPMDDHPLMHYGNWIDSKTLRLEITENGETVRVEFKIKDNGDFEQIHSNINSKGEQDIRLRTNYSKIK